MGRSAAASSCAATAAQPPTDSIRRTDSMSDPRIQLKNPYIAGVLGYFLPGVGHLYQGRLFKGCLYLVCILGTYLYGLYLSDWKAVYWRWEPRHHHVAFFAQAGVGAFAVPALIQAKRYEHSASRSQTLTEPLADDFVGVIGVEGRRLNVSGRIHLNPVAGRFGEEVQGSFKGTVYPEDGEPEPIELELVGPVRMGPLIAARNGRQLACEIIETTNGREERIGWIAGEVPRSFFNYFAAPLQDEDLQRLNRNLGRTYELAKVFTWIAGLLNILAVWDALEGPAYGYGDEEEQSAAEKKRKQASDKPAGNTAAEQSEKVPQPSQTIEKPVA